MTASGEMNVRPARLDVMVATQQRLGALLVDMGFIDDAQLASALEEQQRTNKRLGKILVEAAVLTEDRLVHALSRQLGIEACDPIMTRVHERVLALVPAAVAFKHRVLPVARQREAGQRDVVYVATSDPLDQEALHAIEQTLGDEARVQWMLAGETEMELALTRHYGQQKARVIPQGTKVITGVPVLGPPRTPESDNGSRSVLASTDDIFTALSEDSSDVAVTEQDRPLPSLDIDMVSADLPGSSPSEPAPFDFPTSSTEEIVLAEDVLPEPVDSGLAGIDSDGNGGHDATLDGETLSGGLPDEVSDAVQVALTASTPRLDSAARLSAVSLSEPAAIAAGSMTHPESPIIPAPRVARSSEEVTDDLPVQAKPRSNSPPLSRAFAGTPISSEEPHSSEPSWGDLVNSDASLPEGTAKSPTDALWALAQAVELLPEADSALAEDLPEVEPDAVDVDKH
ncbi:MAG: hypothetical protein AAF449_03645, partial [Myxococcota bacterium]